MVATEFPSTNGCGLSQSWLQSGLGEFALEANPGSESGLEPSCKQGLCQYPTYYPYTIPIRVENTNVSRLVYSSVCSETFLSSSGSLRVGGGKCSFLQVTGPEDCAAGNTSYAGVDCGKWYP